MQNIIPNEVKKQKFTDKSGKNPQKSVHEKAKIPLCAKSNPKAADTVTVHENPIPIPGP